MLKKNKSNLIQFHDKFENLIKEKEDLQKFKNLFKETKIDNITINFSQRKEILNKEFYDDEFYYLIYIYMLWILCDIYYILNNNNNRNISINIVYKYLTEFYKKYKNDNEFLFIKKFYYFVQIQSFSSN